MSNTVAELEQQLKDCESAVDKRDKALRLYDNPLFKELIVDGFCLHDCARFVQLSQDPSLRKENQEDALHMAQAAGHLKRFLSVLVQMGNAAQNQIEDLRREIEEARQENV